MSRSEERVDSIPWTKMMHLMVNRRQVPDKKTSSVNETLNEGLVTFALDRQESGLDKPQQILKHPPRRSYKYPEPDSVPSPRNFGEEAVGRADFERGVANSANSDGDGIDWSSSKKPLGGNKRHRRSASLDAPQLDTIRLGPTLTTSLSFKEPRNISPMPEKLTADDSTGKFAYISLDGRLINAELATSLTTIGGKLADEEARAWEDFAPMQRVLIVAVAAAAAAAAKHRNIKEIDRLLKTVENRVLRNRQHRMHRILSAIASFFNIIVSSLHTIFWALVTALGVTSLWTLLRWAIVIGRLKLLPYMMCSQEKELISLSQELNEICKLKKTNASRDHPEPFWGSSKTPAQQKVTVLRRTFDGDNVKVNLNLQEGWSSTKNVAQMPFVESSPCRSDLFSTRTSPVRAKEEAKWYVNPMVESSQDSDDISTPERCNSMFSAYNPAMQGSFEWTSSGSRETDVSTGLLPLVDSPLTTPTQTTVSTSSYQTRSEMVMDGGAVHKPMRALCAAVVLDLRKRILLVLDKEVSMVMAALDTSVKGAKIQVASMHLVIASCWNDSLPKALAALSLSPSEFDSYLLNEAQGRSPWNEVSKIEENIVAWRQYLEKNYGATAVSGVVERKSPNKLDEEDVTELVKQLQSKEVEIADLKKAQKALLKAKNKEIEVLKEDLKSRDAELDKLLAAAETTKAASADRSAMMEEICREKDSTISDLKQDIQSLESKVQKSRVYQSPAVPRSRRYSTSSTPSSSSGHGTSQKQRFSDKHAPSSDPGSDPILEHIGRFRKEVPSNKGHFRNLPHLNTQRHEDLTDDGRSEQGYDQETSLDYSSPTGSTIGDDCSVNSLVFSETEVESRFGSEYCSSGDDSRCRSSKDRLSGTKDSAYNRTLQKQKSMSSDLRRAVTSSASSVRILTRTQSSKSYTSATSGSKTATGERIATKPLHRTLSGEIKKVIKGPNSPGSSPGSSPRTSNLKGLGSTEAVNHRRSSSLDMNFKSNIPASLETSGLSGGSRKNGSPHSQDNSATKQKRWV